MIYVKNNKRYSNNQLARMGVKDPFANGFSRLIDVRPSFNNLTHKIKDIGTENGAVVYEIVDLTDAEIEAERKARVPQTITPRQARLILLQLGLLDNIEAIIADNKSIQIWWEYSLEIVRDNAQLLEFANIAGLTEEELDNIFIEGAKI